MGNNFFDDEEELELRPRRRSLREDTDNTDARPRRSADGATESPRRPVRKSRADIQTDRDKDSTRDTGRDGSDRQRVRPRRSDTDRQPVRRKSSNEIREIDDFEGGFSPVGSYLNYIALALVVIAVTVCSVKFLGMSIVIVLVIQVILVLMGVFLRHLPSFVPVLLAFLILLAGMITGKTDLVLCGMGTYLATVLALKEN